jgi:UDP-N-acetyl-D-glucosamine dehydrogenase
MNEVCLGIIGLGYVGLPLCLQFARSGVKVIGFDIDQAKVDACNTGRSYIRHIEGAAIQGERDSGRFSATADFARIQEANAILICVPTPLNANREPDLTLVKDATAKLAGHLRRGQLVTLESTTYPGTTRDELAPILEAGSGMTAGVDFHLAFSPERVDPGRTDYTTKSTPKVVGGLTPACSARAMEVYGPALDHVVPVSTPEVAEMTKLLENIFRSVNIALMNELLVVSERMGINIWEVVDAAKTKPFGFMPFYPGPGLGGHCIPIDPFYLSWKARQYDLHTEFIELAGKTNEAMPYYVVKRLMQALNTHRKPLAGSCILVLGVAYKANIDDMRESPAIKIAELLLDAEADVVYHDPFVPAFTVRGTNIPHIELTDEAIGAADAVVVVTDHRNIDYHQVWRGSKLILDTRNAMKDFDGDKVFRL